MRLSCDGEGERRYRSRDRTLVRRRAGESLMAAAVVPRRTISSAVPSRCCDAKVLRVLVHMVCCFRCSDPSFPVCFPSFPFLKSEF